MRLWAWPMAIGLLTIIGLLSALIGETGFWLGLSWVAFSVPIAVIIRYGAPAFYRVDRSARKPERGNQCR